jgi:predicted nucleic acid-binding protein
MKLTIDTSAALKLVLEEPGSDEVEALALGPAQLIAPDIIHAEMANGLWANALSKRIAPDKAIELNLSWQPMIDEIHSSAALADHALKLSIALRHAIYDCLFLALAIRESAPLVTADTKFLRLLEGTPYREFARPLAPGQD